MPFKDFSQEQNQEVLAQGMTDDIITKLRNTPGLKVISPTSSGLYKKTSKPLTQIGQELKISKILEGYLELKDGKIRVKVKLIDINNRFTLWSQKYERQV